MIPNDVGCEYFSGSRGYFRNPPTVIFTGNMAYRSNQDAAVFFIRDVLPLVRSEHPVVGKKPSLELRAHAGAVRRSS